jgi:hypothetical protein
MADPHLASPADQKYGLPAVATVRQPAIGAAPGYLLMEDFCSSAADADKVSGRWPGLVPVPTSSGAKFPQHWGR